MEPSLQLLEHAPIASARHLVAADAVFVRSDGEAGDQPLPHAASPCFMIHFNRLDAEHDPKAPLSAHRKLSGDPSAVGPASHRRRRPPHAVPDHRLRYIRLNGCDVAASIAAIDPSDDLETAPGPILDLHLDASAFDRTWCGCLRTGPGRRASGSRDAYEQKQSRREPDHEEGNGNDRYAKGPHASPRTHRTPRLFAAVGRGTEVLLKPGSAVSEALKRAYHHAQFPFPLAA